MVDHVGIIVLLVVLLAAPVWALFFKRRRTAGSAAREPELDSAERVPEDSGVTESLLGGMLIYLLVQTLVLLLVLWALAFHAVGLFSLLGLLIPMLLGLIHAWRVGALKW